MDMLGVKTPPRRCAPTPLLRKGVSPPESRIRGFTLLEVLVAMALLALIMTLAYQGLSTGAHITATGTQAIERNNQLRLAQTFMRAQLSRASPQPFDSDETLGSVVFEGGSEVLRFVGPMPGYLSFGGDYIQTLALVRGDGGMNLVFDHQVLDYGPEAEEAQSADDLDEREPVVLLGGIDDAEFSYLEPPESLDQEPRWVSEWQAIDQLPLMVKLDITMHEHARIHWPGFQVALRVDAAGSERPQLFDFGPGPTNTR